MSVALCGSGQHTVCSDRVAMYVCPPQARTCGQTPASPATGSARFGSRGRVVEGEGLDGKRGSGFQLSPHWFSRAAGSLVGSLAGLSRTARRTVCHTGAGLCGACEGCMHAGWGPKGACGGVHCHDERHFEWRIVSPSDGVPSRWGWSRVRQVLQVWRRSQGGCFAMRCL